MLWGGGCMGAGRKLPMIYENRKPIKIRVFLPAPPHFSSCTPTVLCKDKIAL